MGAIGHDGLAVPGKVALAHEPAFQLGHLAIHPSIRQIERGDTAQTIEPRVMQVLVALVRAKGGIVTRDELTAWCWDGRIVGDDAINRTLSRIRAIAAGIGEGSFQVETIAKVGYRLVSGSRGDQAAPVSLPSVTSATNATGIRRRQLVGGTIAAGAVALGGMAWWTRGYRPTAEAAEYYRKGVEARSLGLIESTDQAIVYFLHAVRADPNYADAWGALARQRSGTINVGGDQQLDRRIAEVKSAAGRALALDPDQADAQGALASIEPFFRQWRRHELGLDRVIRDHPGQRTALIALGFLYSHVARWEDAITVYRQVRRETPQSPGSTGQLTLAYWSAGRLEEAEAESLNALERWPRFHGMWFTRMMLLTYGGRPEQAIAFAENPDHHPSGWSNGSAGVVRLATAKALVSRDPVALARVRDRLLADVEREILNAPQAVRFLAAVGQLDMIFELLDAYFYRRGRFAAAAPTTVHPATQVTTDFLFHPTSRILWGDRRFAALTRDIGLDAYWRSVGFVPAHRR